jgi:hypothetical protein
MTLLMSLLFVIEILTAEVCSVEIDVFVVGLFICSEPFFALYIWGGNHKTFCTYRWLTSL